MGWGERSENKELGWVSLSVPRPLRLVCVTIYILMNMTDTELVNVSWDCPAKKVVLVLLFLILFFFFFSILQSLFVDYPP